MARRPSRDDTAERRRMEQKLRILTEFSDAIASSLDYDATFRNLARVVVPELADWCSIDELREDGTIQRLAVVHKDPAKEALARELQALYPIDPNRNSGVPLVLRTGRAAIVAEVPDELLQSIARDARHLELLRGIGHQSIMTVPLQARGRTLGALGLIRSESGHRYGPEDLELAELLAHRAAMALDNARLFAAEQREREAAQRLAAQIAEERGTLAAVMASMSDGLVLLDTDGGFGYFNERAASLLGFDHEVPPAPRKDGVLALLKQGATDEVQVVDAWRHGLERVHEHPAFELHADGPPSRDLLVQLFRVAAAGGSGQQGIGLLLRDVTAERDLARTKDEIVSVVSHELRTPLASLVGFAELLLTRDYPDAERRQYLTVMLEEGRRLTALINDFLDLQRMESGRQTIAPMSVEVGSLLDRALAAYAGDPLWPISLDLPEPLPPVWADTSRLLQVLSNLLSNARKYSPHGGAIRVGAQRTDGQVEISVGDQGLGLPSAAIPLLFEKFYRVDNSDRRGIAGTGLGLAICRKIVESHGGRIWAESEGLGLGTCVRFTVPIAPPSVPSGDVLVVEDDIGFARLLDAELATKGLSSVRVASAEEAISYLAGNRPRAVLLDLLLPGAQGEALLARMRVAGGAAVPVVVVTAKDLDAAEQAAFVALHARAVFRKGPGAASAAVAAVADTLSQPAIDESPPGSAVPARSGTHSQPPAAGTE